MRLIKLNKEKTEICQALNLSEDQFLSAVQRLVEYGHEITRNYIKILCDIESVDFDQLRSNISDETLHCGLLLNGSLIEIQLAYQQSTEVNLSLEFIRLMVIYYKVRDHLNRSQISYFDFDDQSLKNATKLIANERSIPNQNNQENVPPYPSRTRFSYFLDYYDFDDYQYCNGWEENEEDSEDGLNESDSDHDSDNHDTDNETEEEPNSDDESDEQNADDGAQNDADDGAQWTNTDNNNSLSKETSSKRHSESLSEENTSPKRRRS